MTSEELKKLGEFVATVPHKEELGRFITDCIIALEVLNALHNDQIPEPYKALRDRVCDHAYEFLSTYISPELTRDQSAYHSEQLN
jgi:hypothetical protein